MKQTLQEWFYILKKNSNYVDIFKLLLARYLIKPNSIRFGGLIFPNFDSTLYTTIREVFLKRDYTPDKFKIKDGDVVVDFGAHLGVFVAYAKKHGAKKVYAFEADPRNYSKLKDFVEVNNLEGTSLENKAIAGRNGEIQLMKSKMSTRNSILLEKDEFSNEAEFTTVESVDMDTALDKISHVDFIKIDIEGAEYDTLKNCSKETLGKIDAIVLEYHLFPNHRFKELESVLRKNFSHIKITEPRNNQFGYIYCKRQT
jgi:FkbM family methyltransferase